MITVQQLIDKTGFKPLTPVSDAEITSGYVCDMLSWVMARARLGTAWITVQAHVNVVAVAALTGCACVIVPDSIDVSEETLSAARDKEVCILGAPCTSYGAAAALHDLGVGEVER
jgi:hypothetical protein